MKSSAAFVFSLLALSLTAAAREIPGARPRLAQVFVCEGQPTSEPSPEPSPSASPSPAPSPAPSPGPSQAPGTAAAQDVEGLRFVLSVQGSRRSENVLGVSILAERAPEGRAGLLGFSDVVRADSPDRHELRNTDQSPFQFDLVESSGKVTLVIAGLFDGTTLSNISCRPR